MSINVDQARDLMARIREGLPQLLGLAWDESKHPRAPEGGKGGGQWVAVDGGSSHFPMRKDAEKHADTYRAKGHEARVQSFRRKKADGKPGEMETGHFVEVRKPTPGNKEELAADEDLPSLEDEDDQETREHIAKTAAGGFTVPEKHWKYLDTSFGDGPPPYFLKVKDLAGNDHVIRLKADAIKPMTGRSEPKLKPWAAALLKEIGSKGQVITGETSIHKKDWKTSPDNEVAFLFLQENSEQADELRAAGSATGPFRALAATSGKVRRAQLFGESHLVVPVRALKQAVIFAHGARTPEFVPAESFSRHAMAWNMRPVMAGHPMKDGEMVSAADPAILDARMIGWTFASAYDGEGRALDMEAWVNERRSLALGGDPADVVRRLQRGETVEVSVGAHVDVDPNAEGEYDGRKYRGAWRGLSSDHLAFLKSGERGACSIEMGCGAQRSASDSDPSILNRAACDGKEHTPDGSAHLDGSPCACRGAHSTTDRKDDDMTPITAERAAALAANPRNSQGATILPFLKTLTEEQATAWEGALPEAKKDEPVKEKPRAATAAEYVANAPDEFRDFLTDGVRAAQARKDAQVAALRALGDKRCPYSEIQLKTMSTADLDHLITLSGIQTEQVTGVDFSGQLPRARAAADNKDDVFANPPDPWAAPLKVLQGQGAAAS